MGILRESFWDLHKIYKESNRIARIGMLATAIGLASIASGATFGTVELINSDGQPTDPVGSSGHDILYDLTIGGGALTVVGFALSEMGGKDNNDH